MKNVKKFVSVLSAVAMASCMTNVIAYADEESDMIAKDEIIEYIWNDLYDWDGGDDGTVYPEASFKHNILVDWVDTYYGKDVSRIGNYYGKDIELDVDYYEWSDIDRVYENYCDYLEALWKDYDDHDDDDGNYYLSLSDSDEVLYRFELINGTWNMIDTNGNTVDTFPIVSTLEEDSSSDTGTSNRSGSGGTARVTGTYYSPETTTTTARSGVTAELGTDTAVATETSSEAAESVTEDTSGDTLDENGNDGNARVTGGAAIARSSNTAVATETSSEVAESVTEEDTSGNYTVLVIGGVTVLVLGTIAVVAYKKKK